MNLLVVPVVIGCTSLVTALGVASLAAHTIIRQIWDFWSQLSQCLNISAQTMIAGALGKVTRPQWLRAPSGHETVMTTLHSA